MCTCADVCMYVHILDVVVLGSKLAERISWSHSSPEGDLTWRHYIPRMRLKLVKDIKAKIPWSQMPPV